MFRLAKNRLSVRQRGFTSLTALDFPLQVFSFIIIRRTRLVLSISPDMNFYFRLLRGSVT